MKAFTLSIIFLLLISDVNGQNSSVFWLDNDFVDGNLKPIEWTNTQHGLFVYSYEKMIPSSSKSSFFEAYFELYQNTSIYYSKEFAYNFIGDFVEVDTGEELVKISGENLRSFTLIDGTKARRFVNAKYLLYNETGFLELVYSNEDTEIFQKTDVNATYLDPTRPYEAYKSILKYDLDERFFVKKEINFYEITKRQQLNRFLKAYEIDTEMRPKELRERNTLVAFGNEIASI